MPGRCPNAKSLFTSILANKLVLNSDLPVTVSETASFYRRAVGAAFNCNVGPHRNMVVRGYLPVLVSEKDCASCRTVWKTIVGLGVILIRPRVPRGANGVDQAYTIAKTELRLMGPVNFRIASGGLGHTNLSC